MKIGLAPGACMTGREEAAAAEGDGRMWERIRRGQAVEMNLAVAEEVVVGDQEDNEDKACRAGRGAIDEREGMWTAEEAGPCMTFFLGCFSCRSMALHLGSYTVKTLLVQLDNSVKVQHNI